MRMFLRDLFVKVDFGQMSFIRALLHFLSELLVNCRGFESLLKRVDID
jgi:hypothetical protein